MLESGEGARVTEEQRQVSVALFLKHFSAACEISSHVEMSHSEAALAGISGTGVC